MELILRPEIQRLRTDTDKTKSALERLEQDHDVWSREGQKQDLAQIIQYMKSVESDVCLLMGYCYSLGHQFIHYAAIEDFHHAYVYINALFQDLKKARLDLNKAYIHPEELEDVKIDWDRLRKTIEKIQMHLQAGFSKEA